LEYLTKKKAKVSSVDKPAVEPISYSNITTTTTTPTMTTTTATATIATTTITTTTTSTATTATTTITTEPTAATTTTETTATEERNESKMKSIKAREIVWKELKNGNTAKLTKCPFCTSIAVEKYCTTLYCPGPQPVNTITRFSQTKHYQEMLTHFINKLNEGFSMHCSKRLDFDTKKRCGRNIHMERDPKNAPFLTMDCSMHKSECSFYYKPGDDTKLQPSIGSETTTSQQPDIIINEDQDSTTESVPRIFIIGYAQHVPKKLPNTTTLFLPTSLHWNQETEHALFDELCKLIGNFTGNSERFERSPEDP